MVKLEDVIRERAKRRMLAGVKDPTQELGQGEPIHTNEELGKIFLGATSGNIRGRIRNLIPMASAHHTRPKIEL